MLATRVLIAGNRIHDKGNNLTIHFKSRMKAGPVFLAANKHLKKRKQCSNSTNVVAPPSPIVFATFALGVCCFWFGLQADAAAMLAAMQQQQQDVTGAFAAQMAMAATAEQQAQLWQQQQELLQAYAGSAQQAVAAEAVVAAGAAALSAGAQMPRVGSLNALSLEVPSASQQDAGPAGGAAAAAAAASAAGAVSYMLPSPSVLTGGALGYSLASGSQLQLQTTGSDFANYAAGAPSVGGAGTTSGFTAGGCRWNLHRQGSKL